MKPLTIAITALIILGCPQNTKAQEKPATAVGQYQIPTANKPKPPIFPTTDQWETGSVGPLTMEKRTRLSPFDPLTQPKYTVGIMLEIPTSNVRVAPFFRPCNKLKGAPQNFVGRCRQVGLNAKFDLNKKPEKLNPGGRNGSFK